MVRVCCWNVLADVYAHRQVASIPPTPSSILGTSNDNTLNFESTSTLKDSSALSWTTRFDQISSYLDATKADIFCLQEVDHFADSFEPFLQYRQYECLYLQRPERKDGCMIAFKKDILELSHYDYVNFDDIATLVDTEYTRSHYKKKNVAMIAHFNLKSNPSPDLESKQFVIANTHMYWNPNKPNLKLAQSQYLLERLNRFMCQHNIRLDCPIIAAGDFNSLPNSALYSFLTHPEGLPWTPHGKYLRPDEIYGASTKFLCDHSLSRLCRWMRILGIDTAIQSTDGSKNYVDTLGLQSKGSMVDSSKTKETTTTNPSEGISSTANAKALKLRKHRTSMAFEAFFERAKNEKRIVLTTSKQMVERANCPPCLLIPSTKLGHLEIALADVCRHFSLTLDPDRFLTVCGKCGGEIELYDIKDMQEQIKSGVLIEDKVMAAAATKLLDVTSKVQKGLPTDRPLYACVECLQPYWWNDKESSSPARAMRMAEKLYKSVQIHLASHASQTDSPSPDSQLSDSAAPLDAASPKDTDGIKIDDTSALNALFANRDKFLSSAQNTSLKDGQVTSFDAAGNTDTESTTVSEANDNSSLRLHLTSAFVRKHGCEPETTNWCDGFSG